MFVKPLRSGSSFGITRAEQPEQLPKALETAFAHDTEIVLEEAIPGFEVGCAVMGNETLACGAVDEIEISGGFLDFREKYGERSALVHCPARLPREKMEEIQETATSLKLESKNQKKSAAVL